MNFYKLLLVGSGGFLGSVIRYISSKSIDEKLNALFPYGTFTVNVVGAFIVGIIYAWAIRKPDAENIRLLLATGFCGGFTTYSAFALENVNLWQQKIIPVSVMYIIFTLFVGFLAVVAGLIVGKNI
jgi:CrcB protein